MKSLSLKIPSIIENIRLIESFIDNAKIKLDINEDIYGNIMVAATESVSNAIIHGNKNDTSKNVFVELCVDGKKLLLLVTDEGEGYEYEKLPDPTAPENIAKPGGRGIFLMKNLCDEIEFSDNGRAVKMEFNCA